LNKLIVSNLAHRSSKPFHQHRNDEDELRQTIARISIDHIALIDLHHLIEKAKKNSKQLIKTGYDCEVSQFTVSARTGHLADDTLVEPSIVKT